MKRLALAGVVMVAGIAAAPNARAGDLRFSGGIVINAGGDRGYDDHWRGGNQAFRYGYDRGWRDGSDEGNHDGRKHRDPRYWREGEFRDADRGYKGWMGPRWDYTRGFREGYAAGYRRAYAASRPWQDRDRWDGRSDRRDDRYRDWDDR